MYFEQGRREVTLKELVTSLRRSLDEEKIEKKKFTGSDTFFVIYELSNLAGDVISHPWGGGCHRGELRLVVWKQKKRRSMSL